MCSEIVFYMVINFVMYQLTAYSLKYLAVYCLPAMIVSNLPPSGAAVCITLGGCTVNNTPRSQIENRYYCLHHQVHSTPSLGGSRRNIVITFGSEKLEWFGYPTVKKNLKIPFGKIHERDRQTDVRTLRDGIGRAYAQHRTAKIAILDKNLVDHCWTISCVLFLLCSHIRLYIFPHFLSAFVCIVYCHYDE